MGQWFSRPPPPHLQANSPSWNCDQICKFPVNVGEKMGHRSGCIYAGKYSCSWVKRGSVLWFRQLAHVVVAVLLCQSWCVESGEHFSNEADLEEVGQSLPPLDSLQLPSLTAPRFSAAVTMTTRTRTCFHKVTSRRRCSHRRAFTSTSSTRRYMCASLGTQTRTHARARACRGSARHAFLKKENLLCFRHFSKKSARKAATRRDRERGQQHPQREDALSRPRRNRRPTRLDGRPRPRRPADPASWRKTSPTSSSRRFVRFTKSEDIAAVEGQGKKMLTGDFVTSTSNVIAGQFFAVQRARVQVLQITEL